MINRDVELLRKSEVLAARQGYRLQRRAGSWDVIEVGRSPVTTAATPPEELERTLFASGLTLEEVAAWLEGVGSWVPPGYRLG